MAADTVVTVRAGTRADVPAALAVLDAAEVVRTRGGQGQHDEPDRARSRLTGPDAFFVVAESGQDGPLGVAVGMHARQDGGAGPVIPGLCHVAMVAVHPERWGQGIGRRLLDALLGEVRGRGYRRAQLFTQVDNIRAQRLYAGMGFRPTGETGRSSAGEQIAHYLLGPLVARPLDLPAEEFQRLAARVAAGAGDLLAGLDGRRIFPPTSGAATAQAFDLPAPEDGIGAAAVDGLPDVAEHSRAGNGRLFGYVVGSGEPVGALGDFYASVLNQNVTAWRSAPAAVAIERTVVRWLAEAIGCRGFTGSLTGGGSSANLMGLAMAREAKAPANEQGARPCVLYASDEVHMSVPKALALLGVGRANLRLIPVDDQFRMRTDALAEAVSADRRSGRQPIAIVASAGTVNTGAIDPLTEIAEIAAANDLWLHVDGAYGALAALAVPAKLAGLALADSVSLDLHKWLYQPIDCSAVLYRDAPTATGTFAYTGDYARTAARDTPEGFAFFEESIELSRRFRALKVWLSVRYYGLGQFREAIRKDLRHARLLAALIEAEPSLQLMAPVQLSAVCFRCTAGPESTLDERNQAILRRVIERGRVYLSNATLRGRFALRACIVNHRTTDDDIAAVVEEVLAAAGEIT